MADYDSLNMKSKDLFKLLEQPFASGGQGFEPPQFHQFFL